MVIDRFETLQTSRCARGRVVQEVLFVRERSAREKPVDEEGWGYDAIAHYMDDDQRGGQRPSGRFSDYRRFQPVEPGGDSVSSLPTPSPPREENPCRRPVRATYTIPTP